MGNLHSETKGTIFELISEGRENEAISSLDFDRINSLSQGGISVFRYSVEKGMCKVAKYCQRHSAKLIPPLEEGSTLLHRAVRLRQYSLAKMILKEHRLFGNLKNSCDKKGRSPLHWAVMRDDPNMVALLIKNNASTTLKDMKGDSSKEVALNSGGQYASDISEQFSIMDSKSTSDQLSSRNELRSALGGAFERELDKVNIPVISSNELKGMELVSRGSSCLVFKAKWRGCDVAVKQFNIEYSSSERERNKFVKEMKVLAQVRHPNLLLLMGVNIDQPNLCLVTEYIPYCSLFHVLHKEKSRKLTLLERFSVSLQICKGLLYLHHNSPPIVHRDLKPENCLLDHNINLKIADFGLARPLTCFLSDGTKSMTTTCIGTTRFMAPELFDNDTVDFISVEVDIWSLGCVLIEVFSGKRPWHYISSANSNSILYEIFHRKPVPVPQNVPGNVTEIIRHCCKYTPQERLKVSEVLERLEIARDKYLNQ